jgi:hypothetical protein
MACSLCGSSVACACSSFTQLGAGDFAHTIIGSLGSVVDCARDIATQLGARPYTVALVWTRWSGGSRGEGSEVVLRVEPILPTPKVADFTALQVGLESIGTLEEGSVRVSEVSTRYTEDHLLGRADDGTEIPGDQSFYWEVSYQTIDGPGPRRRFTPKSAPSFKATRLEWVIDLVRIAEDRSRDGRP